MSKLWMAIIAQSIASIIAFFQLQGWIVYDYKFLKSIWWIYFTSLFIAPLFFGVPDGLMNTSVRFGI